MFNKRDDNILQAIFYIIPESLCFNKTTISTHNTIILLSIVRQTIKNNETTLIDETNEYWRTQTLANSEYYVLKHLRKLSIYNVQNYRRFETNLYWSFVQTFSSALYLPFVYCLTKYWVTWKFSSKNSEVNFEISQNDCCRLRLWSPPLLLL